ncbi:MAG: lysylphosphatidylglycerol synthase domain-containing protein [bacterium]
MRGVALLGLLVGIALLTSLLARQGFAAVGSALGVAGWGLVVVALFHIFPLVLDALGWWRLLPPEVRPTPARIVFCRWQGESVNTLLPVMQIGGPVVRARLLMRQGVAGARAGASVVVDVTLLVFSQIAFTILGIFLLVSTLGADDLVGPAVTGVTVMTLCITTFVVLLRRGLFSAIAKPLAGLAGRVGLASVAAGAANLDERIRELYGDTAALRGAFLLHLIGWIVGTGEVWLALYFLGHPVPLMTAMLLEGLGQAVRAGAFVIPGALGVQEGVFMLLGRTLGIPPETALALSLSKRCRELLWGVPGLIVWQLGEARSLLEASAGAGSERDVE